MQATDLKPWEKRYQKSKAGVLVTQQKFPELYGDLIS